MNRSIRFIRHCNLYFLLALAGSLLAPSKSAHAQCTGPQTLGAVTWTVNWCDEFNGASIDTSKWKFDTGNLGVNNELEIYCDPSSNTAPCSTATPNAFITTAGCPAGSGNSCIAIQVRAVRSAWTSARLNTSNKPNFNSGRIEASIQIPSHAGLWPAFWNLGSQSGVSWPTVGESDIMENWPSTVLNGPGATGNHSTIHTQMTGGNGIGQGFVFPSGEQVDTAFHIYGQIWSANMIQYYVDDPTKPFFVVTASDLPAGDTWPFSSSANPFFIIMNMAVGGTLGGTPDSQTGTQAPMLVDYVRQYLPSTVAVPQMTPNGNITIKAGATTGNTTTIDMLGAMGTGRVTFSCSTTAPKASCIVTSSDSVNNHTVDFSTSGAASPTVTVTTTANAQAAAASSSTWIGMTGAGMLAFVLIPFRKNARRVRFGTMFAVAILAIGLMPACGGGSSSSGPPPPSGGTTPGSYTVTVNAYTVSSSDVANPSASTSFNLTVN